MLFLLKMVVSFRQKTSYRVSIINYFKISSSFNRDFKPAGKQRWSCVVRFDKLDEMVFKGLSEPTPLVPSSNSPPLKCPQGSLAVWYVISNFLLSTVWYPWPQQQATRCFCCHNMPSTHLGQSSHSISHYDTRHFVWTTHDYSRYELYVTCQEKSFLFLDSNFLRKYIWGSKWLPYE